MSNKSRRDRAKRYTEQLIAILALAAQTQTKVPTEGIVDFFESCLKTEEEAQEAAKAMIEFNKNRNK